MPRDLKKPLGASLLCALTTALLVATERTGTRYKVRQEACQIPVSEPGPVFRDSNMGVISSASIPASRKPGLPARTGERMSGNHRSTVQQPCILSEAMRNQGPVPAARSVVAQSMSRVRQQPLSTRHGLSRTTMRSDIEMRQTCMQPDRATAKFATSLVNGDKPTQWDLANIPDLAKRGASTSLRRLKTM